MREEERPKIFWGDFESPCSYNSDALTAVPCFLEDKSTVGQMVHIAPSQEYVTSCQWRHTPVSPSLPWNHAKTVIIYRTNLSIFYIL